MHLKVENTIVQHWSVINMKNSKAHFHPGGAERMKMDDPEFPEQLGREKYFLSLNFGVSH